MKGQGEDLEPGNPISPLQRVAVEENREMGPGLRLMSWGKKHVKMGNIASFL